MKRLEKVLEEREKAVTDLQEKAKLSNHLEQKVGNLERENKEKGAVIEKLNEDNKNQVKWLEKIIEEREMEIKNIKDDNIREKTATANLRELKEK